MVGVRGWWGLGSGGGQGVWGGGGQGWVFKLPFDRPVAKTFAASFFMFF